MRRSLSRLLPRSQSVDEDQRCFRGRSGAGGPVATACVLDVPGECRIQLSLAYRVGGNSLRTHRIIDRGCACAGDLLTLVERPCQITGLVTR